MRYSCTRCGAPSDQRQCPRHRSPVRDRAAQRRFSKAVLERDGHRCTWTEQGKRCTATEDLRAAHVRPLRDFAEGDPAAYDPANGVTRCGPHDQLTDPYARKAGKAPGRSATKEAADVLRIR